MLPFCGCRDRRVSVGWLRKGGADMSASVDPGTRWFEPITAFWWYYVLWATVSVIFGVFLLAQPAASAVFLITIVALLWLVGGVIDILSAVIYHASGWGWHIAGGILAVLIAAVVLAHPIVG